MPTQTGRAFNTANFLPNLDALKTINFGAADPLGSWFVVPNSTTNNIEVWVWEPASTATTNEIDVIRPNSIASVSPGRCIQRLKINANQLPTFLSALAGLSTVGLVERTSGGGAITNAISNFGKTLLNLADAAAGRLALALGNVATRNIGTTSGTIRDAADAAYTNTRTPNAHAATHAAGGADEVQIFGYLAVSANTTLNATHERLLIDVNATATAITITLPAAATVGAGWQIQIRKSDISVNLVTIALSGSDTINGLTSILINSQFESFTLQSLGATSWAVVTAFDNWVDATTDQNIAGDKYFTGNILSGISQALAITIYNNSDLKTINGNACLNSSNGIANLTTAPGNLFFDNKDYEIGAGTSIALPIGIYGGHIRAVYRGSGLLNALQGFRLTAFNGGTGSITGLDGAAFTARNDSASTTVTNLNGGLFVASINVAGTATTINAGNFNASSGATAFSTTVRGVLVNASSFNTTPATECIGIEIGNITGTATTRRAIKTGTGTVLFGDTTASTSTTTGALVVGGGVGIAGNLHVGGVAHIRSAVPGFWLDETDNTQKGAYIVLDGGFLQVQRRAANFGAFEATLCSLNLPTGVFNLGQIVQSTSTTTGTFVCAGGVGIAGNLFAGGNIVNFANLPTSASGLAAGSLWRNGNAVNIV